MRLLFLLLISLIIKLTGYTQNPDQIDMVFIEGGQFEMGCTEKQYACKETEKPAHKVKLDGFYLSKYEITNDQFCAFLNDIEANPGGSYYGFEYIQIGSKNCMITYKNEQFKVVKGKQNHPVVEVTWYGAKAFCHWANGRLPTEAEWEYASRGGNQGEEYYFSGSDTIDQVAWYKHNYYTGEGKKFVYREGTVEVGLKQPNTLGIYDMSGNVWEFCNDWYTEDYYKNSPTDNPSGPSFSNYRVKRGGSYKEEAPACRVSARKGPLPGYSKVDIGFRLCRDVKKSSAQKNEVEKEPAIPPDSN